MGLFDGKTQKSRDTVSLILCGKSFDHLSLWCLASTVFFKKLQYFILLHAEIKLVSKILVLKNPFS
jgi:hypothetical protein